MSMSGMKHAWGGARRDAAIAIMVGALAGCAAPAVAGQASAGASTGQASQALAGTTATTQPLPALGRVWGPGQEGYGKVRPATVFNGGDPTGLVEHITWSSWGGPTATGHGVAYYDPPNKPVAESTPQRATIVAFGLGTCAGHRAYLKVEWYFPEHGQKFNPKTYINDCTGKYVGTW
jgi:hypothetical protein